MLPRELRPFRPWISEHFHTASGPGGQNVNKTATAVQLRFYAAQCSLIDESVRTRLRKIAGRRWTRDGYIVSDFFTPC